MNPQMVPQNWTEWLWSIYSPDKFIIQWQAYGVTVAVPLSSVNTGIIQVPNPFYCFGWRTKAWNASTGAVPTFPYRAGIKNAAQNDWTNGQWASALVSNDNGAGAVYLEQWTLPREVAQNEVLTVTIDNTLNSAAGGITADAVIVGYEIRQRTRPVVRG